MPPLSRHIRPAAIAPGRQSRLAKLKREIEQEAAWQPTAKRAAKQPGNRFSRGAIQGVKWVDAETGEAYGSLAECRQAILRRSIAEETAWQPPASRQNYLR